MHEISFIYCLVKSRVLLENYGKKSELAKNEIIILIVDSLSFMAHFLKDIHRIFSGLTVAFYSAPFFWFNFIQYS